MTSDHELRADTYKRQFSEANTRAKNLTFRLTALQTRFDKHVDYSIDLARIIESLSAGRDIVVPQTMPNMHYGMAADALALRREMLEALHQAKEWLEGWGSAERQLAFIDDAIAKAEGRA